MGAGADAIMPARWSSPSTPPAWPRWRRDAPARGRGDSLRTSPNLLTTRAARRIRADAYERLSTWIPFALPASIFRAAIVEVLGRPLHAGVSLRGGRDDRDTQTESSNSSDPRLELAQAGFKLAQAGLDEVRAELLEVRSELVRVRREGASLRRDLVEGAGIKSVAASPAWAARRQPRVSVVVAAHEDGPQIAETLHSVAASRSRDLELVIVDAARTTARW